MPRPIVLRATLLCALVRALPAVSQVILCPGDDHQAPAARELAGLSMTLEELMLDPSVTISLRGPQGEALG